MMLLVGRIIRNKCVHTIINLWQFHFQVCISCEYKISVAIWLVFRHVESFSTSNISFGFYIGDRWNSEPFNDYGNVSAYVLAPEWTFPPSQHRALDSLRLIFRDGFPSESGFWSWISGCSWVRISSRVKSFSIQDSYNCFQPSRLGDVRLVWRAIM